MITPTEIAMQVAPSLLGNSWLPPSASSEAGRVDAVFTFIFIVCAAFFVIILALMIVFVTKYRAHPWTSPEPSPQYNSKLETLWTGIPLVLALVIFAWSTTAWIGLTEPPAGEPLREVHVTARKWSWWFEHPGGKGAPELHAVKGENTSLTMASEDVLHSFFVPAFRVKADVVPGRYTKAWFRPIEAGEFPILCAEFCGTNHSLMMSQVVVHPDRASYDEWVRGQGDAELPLAEIGKKLYTTRGCVGCHSLDGTRTVGPSFKGLWGRRETLAKGGEVLVDEEYVRESILSPNAKIVSGFAPTMPPMPLSDREIRGTIEFLKGIE